MATLYFLAASSIIIGLLTSLYIYMTKGVSPKDTMKSYYYKIFGPRDVEDKDVEEDSQ
jgi:hypothetical protein